MRYYSLNEYLKETFGEKVYKLSLSLAETCPNRDGSIGADGCIFCSQNGGGEFAQPKEDVSIQIENAKRLISAKTNARLYIAYFQSFTNTYVPYDKMQKAFLEAARAEEICAVSIATRPDCLDERTLELLKEINGIKPVWVELGLQTSNEKSAEYIRRGYKLDVYDSAVERLRASGIKVVTHMIIGLPYETKAEMTATAVHIGNMKSDGIKLQLLHVLKGTELEKEYAEGKFEVLTKEEYIDILTDIIEFLPEDMVIHRLSGDGDKKLLIAPLWSANKKDVLNSIHKAMKDKNTIQGSRYIGDRYGLFN